MKRVLIVDDEAFVIRVLRRALENQGYAVEEAANGSEALEKVRREAPDLLITDIAMPRMTGRELCQAIHRELPRRPFRIMVMTSMTERSEREWVGAISDIRFLEKPLSPRTLVAAVEEYFGEAAGGGEG